MRGWKICAMRLRVCARCTAKRGCGNTRPFWLDNVLVRYDTLARELQAKIVAVRQARRQYDATKTLTPPQELGFFLQPVKQLLGHQ